MPSWIVLWTFSLCFWGPVSLLFSVLSLEALRRCSPHNRTLRPGLVWLGVIPVFNLFWQFVLVVALGRSLGNEYRGGGLFPSAKPGQSLGLVAASTYTASFVGFVAIWVLDRAGLGFGNYAFDQSAASALIGAVATLLFLAGLGLWIVYWAKIHQYSSRLVAPQW